MQKKIKKKKEKENAANIYDTAAYVSPADKKDENRKYIKVAILVAIGIKFMVSGILIAALISTMPFIIVGVVIAVLGVVFSIIAAFIFYT